ncbi:unnamed protein product [Paramecium pentaurelia]|uniref:Transmembrane protein n=1 Tax=Paramecium pentaurelia TaxID=43138 RepID=A0A8S1UEA8_9CILI|nr:unnamed protein product [Paramecium pentaurelia]
MECRKYNQNKFKKKKNYQHLLNILIYHVSILIVVINQMQNLVDQEDIINFITNYNKQTKFNNNNNRKFRLPLKFEKIQLVLCLNQKAEYKLQNLIYF